MGPECILDIVRQCIATLNEELEYEELQNPEPDTVLFGGDEDGIDSLSLVQLIADIEETLEDVGGRVVNLADESAMSRSSSPYRSVGALCDFIAEQLSQQQCGTSS